MPQGVGRVFGHLDELAPQPRVTIPAFFSNGSHARRVKLFRGVGLPVSVGDTRSALDAGHFLNYVANTTDSRCRENYLLVVKTGG